MYKMLNVGCGHRFHKNWINIDVDPASPDVLKVNIIQGLPFNDNSFEVVYHSNVLEHLPFELGKAMIEECYRVLKPGGIIRINVPDLEKICREYLLNMEKAAGGNESASYNYNWILIEMFDQVSRNKSGGKMAEYLSAKNIPNPEYLKSRLGDYFDNWRANLGNTNPKKSFFKKIKLVWKHPILLKKIWYSFVLTKKEKEWLSIGKFRLGGEIHYHMYDRYSLKDLLTKTKFRNIEVKSAVESNIVDWTKYNLDYPNDNAGLFVEAIK